MISWFYKFFDLIIMFPVGLLVDVNEVRRVLRVEILNLSGRDEKTEFDTAEILNFTNHVEIIHARVSTLLTHISIMIAILLITINGYQAGSGFRTAIIIELCFYLTITVFCLRCMRSYGFEKKHQQNRYNLRSLDDLTIRYSLYRLSNFLTMVLTIVFIAILIYNPPI